MFADLTADSAPGLGHVPTEPFVSKPGRAARFQTRHPLEARYGPYAHAVLAFDGTTMSVDSVTALASSALFPVLDTGWSFARSRRPDIIGVVSLTFILVGLVTSLVSGDVPARALRVLCLNLPIQLPDAGITSADGDGDHYEVSS